MKTVSALLLMSAFAFSDAQARNLAKASIMHKASGKSSRTKRHANREFNVCLTYEQELDGSGNPLPPSEKPGNISGKIELCFNKELTEIKFKLFVFNNLNPANRNALISMAHLHAAAKGQNGPIFAVLYNIMPTVCGNPFNGLVSEGTLTNADIIPVVSPNGTSITDVASAFAAIQSCEVYANVHGTNSCEPAKFGFLSGVIRGQVTNKK